MRITFHPLDGTHLGMNLSHSSKHFNKQCTTLSDRSGKDHLNYEHDNDPPMSLGKTYDEVVLDHYS